jgi:hypothetical protein
MKARLFFLLAAVTAILPLQAFDTPHDLPTIEALISLHKLIKGNEDQALARVTASFGEQSIVTKGATEFNATRLTLDSKLLAVTVLYSLPVRWPARAPISTSSLTNMHGSLLPRPGPCSTSLCVPGTIQRPVMPVPGR